MTDAELLAKYTEYERMCGCLPGTLAVRDRYLRKFSREVGFYAATREATQLWLSRDMSNKTRSMWLSTLNVFFTWALNNGYLKFPAWREGEPDNKPPTFGIVKPRLHARHPRPIPLEELQKALANATPQMRCWLLLGALTGCRCQEIALIERADIYDTSDPPRLHIVHGKGERERWVPLHPDVFTTLQALPMPTSGRLWDETPASVSRTINLYLHSLQIRSTAHTLRHYFASATYQACKDLRLTQELMGHSSPQTTAIYAAADQSQAAGVVFGLSVGGGA